MSERDINSLLSRLSPEELQEVIRLAKEKLPADKIPTDNPVKINAPFLNEHGNARCYPICGSINIKSKGYTAAMAKRWMCKDCGKTFTATYSQQRGGITTTESKIRDVIMGVIQNQSNDKISKDTELNIATVWRIRLKLMGMLFLRYGKMDVLANIAEVDGYYITSGYKGKKDPAFFIWTIDRMPRCHKSRKQKIEYLKKHGFYEDLAVNYPDKLERLLENEKRSPGLSNDQVCIATGVDRSGDLYVSSVSLGIPSKETIKNELDGHFASDAIMVTDDNKVYNSTASELGVQHEVIPSGAHRKGPYSLGRVNGTHSKMDKLWPKGSGKKLATKYLEFYLILFWWLEKHSELTTAQKVDELYKLFITPTDKIITVKDIRNKPIGIDTKGLVPKYV